MAPRPKIGITMGDAAGIGPEVVLKSLADASLTNNSAITIIGDEAHLRRVADSFSLRGVLERVSVTDLANLPEKFEIGVDAAVTGKASAENIVKAVDMWRSGEIDAIATAPISKKAISLGGYDFPGHTEFLAELTNTKDFAMSFFAGELRTVLLSTHIALTDAISLVKKDGISDLIRFTSRELGKLLGRDVSLAVA